MTSDPATVPTSDNPAASATAQARKPRRLNLFSLVLIGIYLLPAGADLILRQQELSARQNGFIVGSVLAAIILCWLVSWLAYFLFRRSNRAYNTVFILTMLLAFVVRGRPGYANRAINDKGSPVPSSVPQSQ